MRLPLALFGIIAFAGQTAAQVQLDRVDDFQDGTTLAWSGGSFPTNVANGGPAGAGDRYLQISASNWKLATFNIFRWGGNYNTAGVQRIEADLRNTGPNPLVVRLVLFGTDGSRWSSNAALSLAPGTGWTHLVVQLQAANFTQTVGIGTFANTLGAMDRVMFRHEPVISSGGTIVTGTLGIDNVVGRTNSTTRTLNIQSIDPASGVPITVWKLDKNGQGNGVTAFSRVYDVGFATSLTAPLFALGETRTFDHWKKNGVQQTTLKTLHVTMDGNHTVAAFYKPTYTMSFASSGASSVPITVYQADLHNLKSGTTPFDRLYGSGKVVSMTAPAQAGGNYFFRWEKNGAPAGSAKTVSITVAGTTAMTAVYVVGRTISVQSSGTTGGVPITVYKRDLLGALNGTTTFSRIYADGSSASFTAPATAEGKPFVRWTLDGAPQGTSRTITVNMAAPHTIVAVYQ